MGKWGLRAEKFAGNSLTIPREGIWKKKSIETKTSIRSFSSHFVTNVYGAPTANT